MSDFRSYRKASLTDWGTSEPGPLDREQLQLGATLRMADALETIAEDKIDLLKQIEKLKDEKDRYYKYWREEQSAHSTTIKSRDAFKGLYYKIRSLYNSMIHNA